MLYDSGFLAEPRSFGNCQDSPNPNNGLHTTLIPPSLVNVSLSTIVVPLLLQKSQKCCLASSINLGPRVCLIWRNLRPPSRVSIWVACFLFHGSRWPFDLVQVKPANQPQRTLTKRTTNSQVRRIVFFPLAAKSLHYAIAWIAHKMKLSFHEQFWFKLWLAWLWLHLTDANGAGLMGYRVACRKFS